MLYLLILNAAAVPSTIENQLNTHFQAPQSFWSKSFTTRNRRPLSPLQGDGRQQGSIIWCLLWSFASAKWALVSPIAASLQFVLVSFTSLLLQWYSEVLIRIRASCWGSTGLEMLTMKRINTVLVVLKHLHRGGNGRAHVFLVHSREHPTQHL